MSCKLSLKSLVERLSEGSLTPTRAVDLSLAQIELAEPAVRAWVQLDAAGAYRQARELEQGGPRGRLWGIPVGIKDLIDVAGLPTLCGSKLRDSTPARTDAACVATLRIAGGMVLGKTVTTEFGYFAPGPTRNPNNLTHTPGGSSSGSAAAVAAGMVPLAFGTQTAGSLTRPASYCGIAGFVTPTGQFSTAGITGLSTSLDSLGLLAATVADVHFGWCALAGVAQESGPDGQTSFAPSVLLWNGSDLGELSADMSRALSTAATIISRSGAKVTDWSETELVRQLAAWHATVMAFEAARERSNELNCLDRISPILAELLTSGESLPKSEHARASSFIATARTQILSMLERHDAILGPAALGAAPAGIDATGSPILSRPWQALGFPVVTIPGLKDPAGMPLGVQLIGRPGQEHRLFAAAEWIEANISAPD